VPAVRKTVVPVGNHVHAGGVIRVTPERVRHWADSFNRMSAAGVRVPVPWGHQRAALPAPADDADAQAYLASRFNASYIKNLSADPATGALVMECEPPPGFVVDEASGDFINPKDGTRIGEVSACIGDWTDGTGRVWKDIVAHVALTPLPVVAGQDGFSQLSTGGRLANAVRLATSTSTAEASMADENVETPVEGEGTETPPVEETPVGVTETISAKEQEIQEVKALLAELGVPLPESTDSKTFIEHLKVALTVLKDAKVVRPNDMATPTPPPPPPAPVSTEPPPGDMVTMATASPREKAMLRAQTAQVKGDLERRINALVGRGLPGVEAQKLKDEATRIQLSFVGASYSVPAVAEKVALLERTLPKKSPLTTLSTAKPAPSPADPAANTAEQQAFLDKQIQAVAGPNAKAKLPV
jgi:hypothetical protein